MKKSDSDKLKLKHALRCHGLHTFTKSAHAKINAASI
jgi:hypothetical protein